MAQRSNHEQAKHYLANLNDLTHDDLADAMTYKWFRLNVMYHIKDKFGHKVLFEPNGEQEDFYLNTHGRDIILKARQLGFTTFAMIDALDDCLFTPDFSAGCIAHNLEDAKSIYRDKIRYAYRNISQDQIDLLAEIGYELPTPVNDKDNSYVFSNGSSIKVSVSYRGGTLQRLHVSEFGKICRKYPDKAKEIVTGAFEAVGIGNVITIESTAEGREGYFYEYCTDAKKLKERGIEPSPLEFNFHFFAWWLRDEYQMDGRVVEQLNEYFTQLEGKHGISLTERQKAWYSAKWKVLGEDMKREYPSTPEESFEQSIEGAYYARQFATIYAEGRICDGLKNEAPVNTAWDLGVGDSTAIWFYQNIGNEIHLIDYYENSGEGMEHYFKVLKERGYKYGKHYGPHDIKHREFSSGGKSREEIARAGFMIDNELFRISFNVVPIKRVDDGIEDVRQMLPKCVFDAQKCEQGVKYLESYRKEWDDKRGCWKDRPLHDFTSHCADAFRYMATAEVGRRKQSTAVKIAF